VRWMQRRQLHYEIIETGPESYGGGSRPC
jgi:hypothetical protein